MLAPIWKFIQRKRIRALEKAVRGTDMELPEALLFDCVMKGENCWD